MMNYQDKNILRIKGLFCATVLRGDHPLQCGKHGGQSMRLASHIALVNWKQRKDMKWYQDIKPTPSDISSIQAPPPKDCITFLNSVTSWGPRVQTQEPVGTFHTQTTKTSFEGQRITVLHSQRTVLAISFTTAEGILAPLPHSLC